MGDLQNYSFPSLDMRTSDGNLQAYNIVADLVNPLFDLNLEMREHYCKAALELFEKEGSEKYSNPNSVKYFTRNRKIKRTIEKKNTSGDLFAKLNSYTINQLKNHAMRFGLEEPETSKGTPRPSWGGLKGLMSGTSHSSSNAAESREYEDVLSVDILSAPICDLCIVQGNEAIPDGFYRLLKTPHNKKANLNNNSGGNPIYLCLKKDLTRQIAPVTNLLVLFPDRGENIPPGYHMVHRGDTACNLNTGTGAERVYLCYKKDFLSNPITDLQVIFPAKGESPPKSFNLIDKSVSGLSANLNLGTGGAEIFLTYRQDLVRLHCLLNEVEVDLVEPQRGSKVGVNRRGSIADGLLSAAMRSRSRSPPPPSGRNRDRFLSGSSAGEIMSTSSNKGVSFSDSPAPTSAGAAILKGGDFDSIDVEEGLTKLKLEQQIGITSETKSEEGGEEGLDPTDTMDEWPDLPDEVLNPREVEQATIRKTQEVLDSHGERVAAMTKHALLAILSVVYVRHGSLWDVAISGLMKLFKDTDFFSRDMGGTPSPLIVTMLDLTIEAVCDRFDLSPEADHPKLLDFLRLMIKHSGARLAAASLQRMLKAINYVCAIHATKTNWIIQGAYMPGNDPSTEITPFRVLKQLIWDTVAQVETAEVAQFLPDSDYFENSLDLEEEMSPVYFEMRMIVEDLIDDVIDSIEVSRISEVVMLTISKQTLSITASAFWHSINSFSRKLFVDFQLKNAFVTLAALAKQAWYNIRKGKNGEFLPRDIGSKLVALEALTEFCMSAGEKMKLSKVMGYQIRRIVVPCIMYNISYGLCDHRIFAKLLKIITALWKNWRRHLRIEFAILCDQLVFKVLQATVIQIRPIYPMIVIQEVENWFEQPHVLIEMFVNYDMDRKFVSHWNTFSYLVRSICAIGRRLSHVTSAWDWKPTGVALPLEDVNRVTVTIRDVHLQALHEVSRMAKTLMDASGHAFLIQQDSEFRNRSLGENAGWVEDEDTNSSNNAAATNTLDRSNDTMDTMETAETNSGKTGSEVTPGSTSNNGTPMNVNRRPRAGSIKIRRAAHQEAEALIKEAIKIYTEKQSLKKAVTFLISKDFMPDTPQEIANFLRVYKNSFDPAAIGDFLGEGGNGPIEEEYWSQIRFRYTRAVSFVEMEIEPALRLYLTGCGFRLPGEAQKIDRFVEVFVKAFWQDNSGTQYCPFKHPDTIHLVSYAIIMLNTDLHRANIDTKKKGNKKMTKDEFINNLRGADQGSDINRELLISIYDSIAAQPIELAVTNSAAQAFDEYLKKDGRTAADDMVNSVLSQNNKASQEIRMAEEKKFIRSVGQTLRDAEDLLRSLSPFTYRFHVTNIDTKISLDLVSYMYETVWYHFHAIVEAIFHANALDNEIKFAALDVLCYSLTSAIFLNLKVERMAFATLLKNFRKTIDALPHLVNTEKVIPDDSWYEDVENATEKNTMEIIAKLHHLTVHIKDTIQEATNYEMTRQVAAKFEKRAKVLESNSFFIRQGDLSKLSRTGKTQSYKFFLFSDHLIYAHVNMKKEYVVHEQLSLSALSVSDIDTDNSFTSFYLSHPIKSFVVVAESPAAKQQWIRDINTAIINCKKREKLLEDGPLNRRMSILTRIEDQQQKLEREQQTQQNAILPSSAHKARRGSHRGVMLRTESNENEIQQNDLNINTSQEYIDHSPEEVDFQTVPFSNPPTPAVPHGKSPRSLHNRDVCRAMGNELFDSDWEDDHEKDPHHNNNTNNVVPSLTMPEESDRAGVQTNSQGVTPSSAQVLIPTPAERAQRQLENKQQFEILVESCDEQQIESLFTAATDFWKGMTSSRVAGTELGTDGVKLFAYQKLIKYGDYNSNSETTVAQRLARADSTAYEPSSMSSKNSSEMSVAHQAAIDEQWKALGEMDSMQAKRKFLLTLIAIAPYWKYEQFIH